MTFVKTVKTKQKRTWAEQQEFTKSKRKVTQRGNSNKTHWGEQADTKTAQAADKAQAAADKLKLLLISSSCC